MEVVLRAILWLFADWLMREAAPRPANNSLGVVSALLLIVGVFGLAAAVLIGAK